MTLALVETSSITGNSVTGGEVVVDAVALTDGDAEDVFFFDAPVVGPDGPFFPAGARRIVDGVDTDTAADWALADFSLGPDNTPTASVVGHVDVKPGSCPNAVNPRSNGVIPVAILGDPTFDATNVDPDTVTFGPNGAAPIHEECHVEDVDGDGDDDLVCHFRTRETGVACGDPQIGLAGATYGGERIQGSDWIKTAGCR